MQMEGEFTRSTPPTLPTPPCRSQIFCRVNQELSCVVGVCLCVCSIQLSWGMHTFLTRMCSPNPLLIDAKIIPLCWLPNSLPLTRFPFSYRISISASTLSSSLHPYRGPATGEDNLEQFSRARNLWLIYSPGPPRNNHGVS
jgi:hypothetical protein